jgi:hypothetical protein
MTIHHSQIKKAEKMGVQLTEEDGAVAAFWPKRALKLYASSAADAISQAQAAIAIHNAEPDFKIVVDPHQHRLVDVVDENGMVLKGGPMPPVAAHKLIVVDRRTEWVNPEEDRIEDNTPGNTGGYDGPFGVSATDTSVSGTKSTVERINGVAIDGKVAYSEGTPAGDCPYSSEGEDDEEYENFERWNSEWDEAADAAEEEDGKTGTVVAEKYRAKYAEAGHPTHCGDWLANTLNGLVLNKGGTNLELLEAIADLNNVSLAKYKRDGVGWQGRLRMTARNLMAKKVWLNGGKLMLPQTINGGMMQAPAEWMAEQRYKKPAAK